MVAVSAIGSLDSGNSPFAFTGPWVAGDVEGVIFVAELAGFEHRWDPFAAGALIGAIPVVILFLFLQRFIVSGLTSGAVNE